MARKNRIDFEIIDYNEEEAIFQIYDSVCNNIYVSFNLTPDQLEELALLLLKAKCEIEKLNEGN